MKRHVHSHWTAGMFALAVGLLGQACGDASSDTQQDDALTQASATQPDRDATQGQASTDVSALKAPKAKRCGGLLGIGCNRGEYCKFDASCGAADQLGMCTKTPQVCGHVWAPVCGCDGKTYSNACTAAASGVSVVSQGECASGSDCHSGQPPAEGCWSDDDCAGGSCIGASCCPVGAQCFVADKPGTCQAPVSDCHSGVAPKEGCWTDDDCAGGTCVGAICCPAGAQCFVADKPGTCEPAQSGCHSGVPPRDGCWTDADCQTGTCVGAICCPVGAQCFAADRPGQCR